ncbi:hypothetical protein T440DRAFT_506096 [Plenodomus tracheiphilus IPT5]|uniref:Uncharacterized protein n=1 Tax=Plenodomus tracheiphilus IPT5 TaxID=1408161 RepID=A0A6A7BGH0_9PLEO|nr:hypothetical protein T440DRAFT_506096 [Plenodomus tracheiphilus IPT5]
MSPQRVEVGLLQTHAQPVKPRGRPHHDPIDTISISIARRCARLPSCAPSSASTPPPSESIPVDDSRARSDTVKSPSPAPSVTVSSEHLPRYWTDVEEDLMQRTARDYDLILAYQRDSDGGERWSTEDIAKIRAKGQQFHNNRRALNQLRRTVAVAGGEDEAVLAKIRKHKNKLLRYCEQLDTLERWLEKRPVHHLLDSGKYQEVNGYVYRLKPWSLEYPFAVATIAAHLRTQKASEAPQEKCATNGEAEPEEDEITSSHSRQELRIATPTPRSNGPSSPSTLPYRPHHHNATPHEPRTYQSSKHKRDYSTAGDFFTPQEQSDIPPPARKRQRVHSPTLTNPPSSAMVPLHDQRRLQSGRRRNQDQRFGEG